jgi:hypothetical protein
MLRCLNNALSKAGSSIDRAGAVTNYGDYSLPYGGRFDPIVI